MKINISRQSIYLLFLSSLLLVFVFIFAFMLLIPEGKEYRIKRADLKKETKKLRKYENFKDDVLEDMKDLKNKNKNIITAFDRSFDIQRFKKQHLSYFNSLRISPALEKENEDRFSVYELNTTSQINSPQNFYNFLDAINKSDWIIGINFPIHFQREGELIRSSFSMKVYGIAQDLNKTDLNASE